MWFGGLAVQGSGCQDLESLGFWGLGGLTVYWSGFGVGNTKRARAQ